MLDRQNDKDVQFIIHALKEEVRKVSDLIATTDISSLDGLHTKQALWKRYEALKFRIDDLSAKPDGCTP